MRELGVGLVYWSALTPLFESGDAAVLELEPQTLWTKSSASSGWSYRLNNALFETIAQLPQPKLLHGVGQPVGGTVDDPTEYAGLLRHMADQLQPAWVSEHMSFNRIRLHGRESECGFLLPPPQTQAAVRVASANVRRYARALGRPVAFETGVNYFRPVPGDLADGTYIRAIAEQADCGILLDLHNLWCNERNGRQPVAEALAQMPLERVWEVHFAGGSSLDGFCLDAHSGAIHPELLELAAEVIPRLPNVGALIFEILPEYLGSIGLDGVHRQLETLRALWDTRAPRSIHISRRLQNIGHEPCTADIAEVCAWELSLTRALRGEFGEIVSGDPGCALMRKLIGDFRSAGLTRGLRFTITALLGGLGADATNQLLNEYFCSVPPDAFVAVESHQFVQFLVGRPQILAAVPYLQEILAFEAALVAATLFGETTELEWTADPTLLLDELQSGRLPQRLPHMASRMTVAP